MLGNAGDTVARGTGSRADAARALLDWWALAGADVTVADRPGPWGGPDVPMRKPPQPAADPARDTGNIPPGIDSLAALQAWVAEAAPGAPFADGDPASGLMILGEGPSASDLETGRPFSGPAGALLDRMLAAIGRDRSQAYVGLLCPRKDGPGPARPADIARDIGLARRHVALARPRVLLLMGGAAAQALLDDGTPIGRLRGQWREIMPDGVAVRALATYNPAYLLRRPEDKRHAWADLLAVARALEGEALEGGDERR